MPPHRIPRAQSETYSQDRVRPAEPLDTDVLRTYRKDILELPREVATRITMSDFFKMDSLARYCDRPAGIYNLGDLPVNATWGTGPNERTLCVDKTEAAVWALATLDHMSYAVRMRDKPSLCVTAHLLRESDRVRLGNLNRRTQPKSRELPPSERTLIASADIPGARAVFRHLYDGSTGYNVQSQMLVLGVNDFVPGDIVLVEGRFVRTSYDGWATWSVNMELTALTLIYPVSRTQSGRPNRFRGRV
ncbi:hypothetical protein K466DRAFT_605734 [Polyporus arcularius HHB13444]|uniref:Uncharacterized protein n=1 Tax=Polyporus arcularius HHB13444 TaxID=1314778 RepID=A0A5C3NSF8_9APHY|nr:hypothetical protein K466DRAFT_605734 [Polyporus arcularius HHB13444]